MEPKKTLVQIAQELDVPARNDNRMLGLTDDTVELAVAFAEERVTEAQVLHALKEIPFKTNNPRNAMMTCLKQAIRSGRVELKIIHKSGTN